MGDIERKHLAITVTIGDGTAESEAIDMRPYSGGTVYVPTSWTDANMGFKVCDVPGGTYAILRSDTDGTPIQIAGLITDAPGVYALPDKVFGAFYLKLWSKHKTAATVTDVNQSGAISPVLMLKG